MTSTVPVTRISPAAVTLVAPAAVTRVEAVTLVTVPSRQVVGNFAKVSPKIKKPPMGALLALQEYYTTFYRRNLTLSREFDLQLYYQGHWQPTIQRFPP